MKRSMKHFVVYVFALILAFSLGNVKAQPESDAKREMIQIFQVLYEGFENGMPQGWIQETNWTEDPWTVATGDRQEDFGAYSGSKNLLFTIDDENRYGWFISPKLDLSGTRNAELSFFYVNRDWMMDVDELGVYYRIDEGEWKNLAYVTDHHESWTFAVLQLPAEANTVGVQIAFRGYSHFGYGVAIDSISLIAERASKPSGFDVEFGDTLPDDWRFSYTNEAFQWSQSYGTNYATYSADGEGEAWIISPVMNLDGYQSATLELSYGNLNHDGEADFLVCYRIGGGDWIPLDFQPQGGAESGTYMDLLVPFEAMTDTLQIGFCSISNGDNVNYLEWATLSGNYAYDITVNESLGGSVTVSQSYALEGTFVSFSVSTDYGYVLEDLVMTCGQQVFSLEGESEFEMPAGDVTITATFVNGTVIYYEGFEDFDAEEQPFGWTLIDADGDGLEWSIADGSTPHRIPFGNQALTSVSYISTNNYSLTPDNWAITPGITIPANAVLSFYIDSLTVWRPSEKMGVYVGTEPRIEAMVPLKAEIIATPNRTQYSYSLDEYVGETVYVGFRHYGVTGESALFLDDIYVRAYGADQKDPAIMRYAKASFDGKLGLAFFMELPEWLTSDENAFVTFTQCGETKKMKLSDIVAQGENEDGCYRIATYMPAAYHSYDVVLRLYAGNCRRVTIVGKSSGNDLTDDGVVYTLNRYVMDVLSYSDPVTQKLMIAIRDYCKLAAVYFGLWEPNLGNPIDNAVYSVTAADLEEYKSVRIGTLPAGITGISLKASFESDNTLKLGLTFKDNKKPANMSYYISEDGSMENAVPVSLRGNKTSGYYLAVRNIPAAYLGKPYTFIITDGTDTFSCTCSIFTYVRATAFSNDPAFSDVFKDMTKSLYIYGKAAEAYFFQ